MKIGFFTDTYYPNVDGVVRAIGEYKHALEHAGNQVSVFTSGSKKARLENTDKSVHYFSSVAFPPYPQYKLAVYPFKATAIAREEKIELIHCHAVASMGVAAIQTSRSLNLPAIATFHTMLPYGAKSAVAKSFLSNRMVESLTEKLVWRAMRLFYNRFNLLTVPTHAVKRVLREHDFSGAIAVVPNAVNIVHFHPGIDGTHVRQKLGVLRGQKMVLIAGRLSFEKNVDILLKAAAGMKEKPVLVITGEGPARKPLELQAKKLGLRDTHFTGFVSENELLHYYAACDVLATASTFETQCLSLIEAMSCGKICVGANALAIPETVSEGENGFLFQAGDAHAAREALEKALHLPPWKYAQLSKQARATAMHYSTEKAVGELLKAYELVL